MQNMAVVLFYIMSMFGYGLSNRLRARQNATASDRCCCSREEPVPKYVCIDPGSDEVFTPVTELLHTEDFDSRVMFKPTKRRDRAMLHATQDDRQEHSITVTTRVVSKCAAYDGKEISVGATKKSSEQVKASSFKYKGLTWREYLETPSGYKAKGHHVVIDGVVYRETVHSPIPKKKVCVQKETTAWIKKSFLRRSTCVESTQCQKYETTHICGWGTSKGSLYKRVGRIDGECVDASHLRVVGFLGGLGGSSDKCPHRMFHRVSSKMREARGKGFLFCTCKDGCS